MSDDEFALTTVMDILDMMSEILSRGIPSQVSSFSPAAGHFSV